MLWLDSFGGLRLARLLLLRTEDGRFCVVYGTSFLPYWFLNFGIGCLLEEGTRVLYIMFWKLSAVLIILLIWFVMGRSKQAAEFLLASWRELCNISRSFIIEVDSIGRACSATLLLALNNEGCCEGLSTTLVVITLPICWDPLRFLGWEANLFFIATFAPLFVSSYFCHSCYVLSCY